jgi:transposase
MTRRVKFATSTAPRLPHAELVSNSTPPGQASRERASRVAGWLVRHLCVTLAAAPTLRAALRAWQSRPILERLRRALEVVRRRVLPKSLLGQAIDYTLARWPALIRYVDDGRLDIDNNACENSIRPTAVGKKNFLFVGHPAAGQRSAVIYSVLGSCR